MKNSKLNVDLIQSTFGSIKDPASLLGDCEKDLKDFLVAVISNCEILVGEKYVEETTCTVVCFSHTGYCGLLPLITILLFLDSQRIEPLYASHSFSVSTTKFTCILPYEVLVPLISFLLLRSLFGCCAYPCFVQLEESCVVSLTVTRLC